MAPPQLARDAPVIDVVHPVEINLAVIVGDDRDFAAFDSFSSAVSERLNLDEPLLGQTRLDNCPAAFALADRERIVFFGDQKSLFLQIGQHALARFEPIEPGIRARVLVHVRVFVHHVDLRQVVAQAGLKVVGIVRGSDLHRAGAELRLREFVGDDGNLALHQRDENVLPVEMRVALIFRVHSDRGVAQHRFGTGGRYGDELVRADNRIANLPQFPGDVLVLHFEIGDRGFVPRAPVHDVMSAINQAFLIQADEHLAHRVRKVFVHGEVLAVPVDGGAETFHLVEDGAAVELLPFPDALDEFLAAQVAALLAFFGELFLHHHLRGDAGVIGPREPQGDKAAHAMPAHDDVHLRLVEHVAHVQATGNVRRRQEKRKHRTGFTRRWRLDGEQLFFDPVVGPACFNRAWLVRFRQFVRHECVLSKPVWGQPSPPL